MPPGKSVYPVTLALPALSGIVPSALLPEALLLGLDVSRPEIHTRQCQWLLPAALAPGMSHAKPRCRGVCPLTLNQEPIAHIKGRGSESDSRARICTEALRFRGPPYGLRIDALVILPNIN